MSSKRTVFFISDRTGVTAENLGNSLLNQFGQIEFECITMPFIDSIGRAQEVLSQIIDAAKQGTDKVIVFSSLVNAELRTVFDNHPTIFHVDFFNTFIPSLENELQRQSRMVIGLTHGITNEKRYDERMEAINFALNNDDGITERNYDEADIILVGVSRSGKTPTCIYLALQYGILAANYPLTPEDLDDTQLPRMIKNHRSKLFGLTIDYQRLSRIREERTPNSKYANQHNCDYEVRAAESLFKRFNIPYLSTTNRSVEELAAAIIQQKQLARRC